MPGTPPTPDHLIQSILDLAELGWGAHHRMQTRKAGIWIVEGNLTTYVKGLLLGTLKQLADAFLLLDTKTWLHKPCFSPKLESDFQAAFGKSFSDALLGGQLMPHDRACTIGGFNGKSMAAKVVNSKAPSIRIGSGFVIPEIGEGYKCSWINFFKNAKKVELYAVVGIPKHVQALADDLKELVATLKETLVLCGKGQKGPAEALLAAAGKQWNKQYAAEEVRDRLHFVYDCNLGKYPAETDEDGFKPIVVSNQPLLIGVPVSWSILTGIYDLSVSEAAAANVATNVNFATEWDKSAGGAPAAYITSRPTSEGVGATTAVRRKSCQDVNDINQFVNAYTPELIGEKQSFNLSKAVKPTFASEGIHENQPMERGVERSKEWSRVAKPGREADATIIKAAAGESELSQQVRRASITTAE